MLQLRRPSGLLAMAALAALAALGGCATTGAPQNAGYPTLDRVRYVHECMRDNPGPTFEMSEKCSCAIDRIAEQVPYDDYMEMITAANATSIGGERGSYIRDVKVLQDDIKRWRTLQKDVHKACFIGMGIRP